MLNRPFACISDVHGNFAALQVVLSELGRRAISDVLVAGDLLYGGDSPREVWQALQNIQAQCIQGPSDKALYELQSQPLSAQDDSQRASLDRFRSTQQALGDLVLMQLRRLPFSIRHPLVDGGELLLVHGAPLDPFEEISVDLDDAEILRLLNDDPADLIVCGGSHVPFHRFVDNVQVINAGSVGQAPEGAIAHVTVITPKSAGVEVDQLWLPY